MKLKKILSISLALAMSFNILGASIMASAMDNTEIITDIENSLYNVEDDTTADEGILDINESGRANNAAGQTILDISKGSIRITDNSVSGKAPDGANVTTVNSKGYEITGATSDEANKVYITGGTHAITLKNIDIKNAAPMAITGGTVTVSLVGNNILESYHATAPAFNISNPAVVTIKEGETGASLKATAKNADNAQPAIGGTDEKGINLTIESGKITAEGGTGKAAGIGGGNNIQEDVKITINGGTILAKGGTAGEGAAIGTGGIPSQRNKASNLRIVINGGSISALAGINTAVIGGGYNYDSQNKNVDITINGGTINASFHDPDNAGGTGAGAVIGSSAKRGANATNGGTTAVTVNGGNVTVGKTVLVGGDTLPGVGLGIATNSTTVTPATIKISPKASVSTGLHEMLKGPDGQSAVYRTKITGLTANKKVVIVDGSTTVNHTTNELGELYFYYPVGAKSITIDGKTYNATVEANNNNTMTRQTVLDISKGPIEITANAVNGKAPDGSAVTTHNPNGYEITGTTTSTANFVTIHGGTHAITLRDVNIKNWYPIAITSGTVTVSLVGSNILESTSHLSPAFNISHPSVVTIKEGEPGASLKATAASNDSAQPAIGGAVAKGINLTIESGNITAEGGTGKAAGIGGGTEIEENVNITINGGTILAKGGTGGEGAAIGTGRIPHNNKISSNLKIVINGGSITAQAGANTAVIGGGYNHESQNRNADITINGGTVNASFYNGSSSGAAIGSGARGSSNATNGGTTAVTVTGGNVTATNSGGGGSTHGVGLGVGTDTTNVTPATIKTSPLASISTGTHEMLKGSDGAVDVYRTKVAGLTPNQEATIVYDGQTFKQTPGTSGELYFYYPAGRQTINIDGRDYIATVAKNNNNEAFTSATITNSTAIPTGLTVADGTTGLDLTQYITSDYVGPEQLKFTVKNAGNTGATINGNTLTWTAGGSVIVTAAYNPAPGGYNKINPLDVIVNIIPNPTITAKSATLDITKGLAGIDLKDYITSDYAGATPSPLVFTLKNAGATGATLSGDTLKWTTAGTVVVTANHQNLPTGITSTPTDLTLTIEKSADVVDIAPTIPPANDADGNEVTVPGKVKVYYESGGEILIGAKPGDVVVYKAEPTAGFRVEKWVKSTTTTRTNRMARATTTTEDLKGSNTLVVTVETGVTYTPHFKAIPNPPGVQLFDMKVSQTSGNTTVDKKLVKNNGSEEFGFDPKLPDYNLFLRSVDSKDVKLTFEVLKSTGVTSITVDGTAATKGTDNFNRNVYTIDLTGLTSKKINIVVTTTGNNRATYTIDVSVAADENEDPHIYGELQLVKQNANSNVSEIKLFAQNLDTRSFEIEFNLKNKGGTNAFDGFSKADGTLFTNFNTDLSADANAYMRVNSNIKVTRMTSDGTKLYISIEPTNVGESIVLKNPNHIITLYVKDNANSNVKVTEKINALEVSSASLLDNRYDEVLDTKVTTDAEEKKTLAYIDSTKALQSDLYITINHYGFDNADKSIAQENIRYTYEIMEVNGNTQTSVKTGNFEGKTIQTTIEPGNDYLVKILGKGYLQAESETFHYDGSYTADGISVSLVNLIEGDLDDSGAIDTTDRTELLKVMNQSVATTKTGFITNGGTKIFADYNNDDKVNALDLGRLLKNINRRYPTINVIK